MSSDIPEADLRMLPLAKHLGFIEHHEAFPEDVRRFGAAQRQARVAEEAFV